MKSYYPNLIAAILFFIIVPPTIVFKGVFLDPLIILNIVLGISNTICVIIIYRDEKRRRDSEIPNNNR